MPRMVASHFFLCVSMNRVFCTDADRDVRPGRKMSSLGECKGSRMMVVTTIGSLFFVSLSVLLFSHFKYGCVKHQVNYTNNKHCRSCDYRYKISLYFMGIFKRSEV